MLCKSAGNIIAWVADKQSFLFSNTVFFYFSFHGVANIQPPEMLPLV